MNCDISVAIKFAFGSFVNEFLFLVCVHMGVWTGRGEGGQQPTQNLANLDLLGSERNLGKANFKRTFHVCERVVFCRRGIFSILN